MVKRKRFSAPLSSKRSRKRTPVAIPHATEKGKIFICGSNDASQLGMNDDVEELNKLTLVGSLKDKEFTDVVCGGMHSIAIDFEGTVMCKFKRVQKYRLMLLFYSFIPGAAMMKVRLVDKVKKVFLVQSLVEAPRLSR